MIIRIWYDVVAIQIFSSFGIQFISSHMVIYHSNTLITQEDIEAVVSQLESGYVLDGDITRLLESYFKQRLFKSSAKATCSATVALWIALQSLRKSTRDIVILPAYVCKDVLDAVYMSCMVPAICDIDETDLNISFKSVLRIVEAAHKNGQNIAAIVVPHIFGNVANIEELKTLQMPLIEDCSHAIGSQLLGRPVGSFGDYAIFSFQALKCIVGGEGGLVASATYSKLLDEPIHFHLSNITSSLVISQLSRLADMNQKRLFIARKYDECLSTIYCSGLAVRVSGQRGHSIPLRYCLVLSPRFKLEMVIDALSRHDIVCQKPIKSILNKVGNKISKFSDLTPCAELALKGTLSLPAHLKMTNQQIESVSAKVIETLHSLL